MQSVGRGAVESELLWKDDDLLCLGQTCSL